MRAEPIAAAAEAPPRPPRLVPLKAVAKRLGVSLSTAGRYRQLGLIEPAGRDGPTPLYSMRDVRRGLKEADRAGLTRVAAVRRKRRAKAGGG